MPRKTQLYIFLAIVLSAFASCKENENEITGTAKVTLTNAALNSAPVDLYVDGAKITTSSIEYGNSTGTAGSPYTDMNAGIRPVQLISTASTDPVVEGNLVIKAGDHYSMFTYDTLDVYNHLKSLIVSDDLTEPETGNAKVRFFHLSPDASYLDAVIYRTGDTTKFLGNAYVGNTAGSTGLSAYTEISAGLFTLLVKQTDSSYNLITDPITLTAGKIYTIYARGKLERGIKTTQGFNISTLQHN
ncbi:MAG: DUF4397 domain-containing protein [Ferruginibacter sp.]